MAVLASNRNALFEYEILETYEAGLVLTGQEVKSVRAGRAVLSGAIVHVRPAQALLVNAAIPPFQPQNAPAEYLPDRPRRLLLKKKEIEELIGKASAKGLTLIAVKMYAKGPRIKLEFALARRKKKYDKRAKIREREEERRFARGLE